MFQRTPPWMVPKDDRPYSATELAQFRRNPLAMRRTRWQIWKFQHDNTATFADDPVVAARSQIATSFLERTVADERLRHALTPDYPFRCKRVLLGDDYYRALQQDNVELVTDPIDRITETSVVTAAGQAFRRRCDRAGHGIRDVALPVGHRRHRDRRDAACTSAGATTPAPTWAWRSADSRTSSCSTAPTPTRAATRSSTSSRPVRDWWPARWVGWRAEAGISMCVLRPKSVTTNELSADLERTIWTQCDSYFRSPTGRIVTQWPYTELEYARRTWRLRPRDWVHRTGASS